MRTKAIIANEIGNFVRLIHAKKTARAFHERPLNDLI
jgi:hypothetical protein